MTSEPITTQFLRDREHAGVTRAALKALFPPHVWPPEWDDQPRTNEEDDS